MSYIFDLAISDDWKTLYPGAAAGLLAVTGAGGPPDPGFAALVDGFEAGLRVRFAGFDRPALAGLPVLQAYKEYYRRFKKTYHVLLQLESVALKDRPLPRAAPLVEAMFMAELQNQLLTAGHDLAAVQGSLRLGVANGSENYTTFGGETQALKPGDMFISDAAGVISSIIYGPDQRTRIQPGTQAAVYTVYAPPGIGAQAVQGHLENLRDFVLAAFPQARPARLEVYGG